MNIHLRFVMLTLLLICMGGAFCAQAQTTYTHTFQSGDLGTSNSPATTATLSDVGWTVSYSLSNTSSTNTYFGSNSTKGLQLGSANYPFTEYTLSTTAFSGTVTSVTVNASTASSATATVEVSVGGTSYGSQSLSTTAADYSFSGSASGTVTISLKQSNTKKALYIKSIDVTYGGGTTPSGAEETATFVFNTADGLTALGIPTTTSTWTTSYKKDGGTQNTGVFYNLDPSKNYTSGNATFSTTDNAALFDDYNVDADGNAVKLNTRVWYNNSNYTLRFYKGSSITIGGAKDYQVKSISFSLPSSTEGGYYNASEMTTDAGTFTIDGTTAMWTAGDGKSEKYVTFYIPTDKENTYLTTITVNLVKVTENTNTETAADFQVVHTFAELKSVADGTPVVLDLADAANVRVLYDHENLTFLRDNTGAVCFYGFVKTPQMKYNQHVAGSIVGEKNTVGGMPVLRKYGTLTNCAFLVVGEQVTEADVEPTVITADDYASHYADWVTVKDLDVTAVADDGVATAGSMAFGNDFGLTAEQYYNNVYQGALVDLSGIAYPVASDSHLAAVYNLSATTATTFKPITYVMDEGKPFTSPAANIEHARVRLVRTLYKDGGLNTLTLPFDYTGFEGKVYEYDTLDDDGHTMNFREGTSIQAGVPYLVQPNEDMVNPVFDDVTLTATAAKTISNDDGFSFIGSYSPVELLDDGTHLFLAANNKLKKPYTKTADDQTTQTMLGMRAYFQVPGKVIATAKVGFHDETTAIESIQEAEKADTQRVYTLDGRYVGNDRSRLAKGIYVVGNKKIIVK